MMYRFKQKIAVNIPKERQIQTVGIKYSSRPMT